MRVARVTAHTLGRLSASVPAMYTERFPNSNDAHVAPKGGADARLQPAGSVHYNGPDG